MRPLPQPTPEAATVDRGCLDDLAGHLLRHAFLRGQQVFAEVFEGEGLTPFQFMVMELVDRNPGITHRDVASAMSSVPSVLTTALKPLLASGQLERIAVDGDGRRVAYRLSRQGRDSFHALRPRIAKAEDRLLAGFDPAARSAFLAALRSIAGRSRPR
ncbi:MarR family winged helix-turn-helix transcriptional regulator [Stappia sp. ICDLI1TA098]